MFVKILVFSLLAATTLQAETSYDAFDVVYGNIIDDANDALQKLVDKIQEVISNAIKQMNAILKDLMIYADEIVKQYTTKIQEEFKKLLDQLNKIKDDAKKGNVDINDCLRKNEVEFLKLPAKYTAKMIGCVTSKVEEAKNIIASATNDIVGTMVGVNQTRDELNKCGGGIEALSCAARVMAKITSLGVSLPIKISAEATKAAKLVITLKPSLKACAADNTLQMAVEGQQILANIITCVNAKNTTKIVEEVSGGMGVSKLFS